LKKPPSPKIKKRRAKKSTNQYSKSKDNPHECNDLKKDKPSTELNAESKITMFENKDFKDHKSSNEFFKHTQ